MEKNDRSEFVVDMSADHDVGKINRKNALSRGGVQQVINPLSLHSMYQTSSSVVIGGYKSVRVVHRCSFANLSTRKWTRCSKHLTEFWHKQKNGKDKLRFWAGAKADEENSNKVGIGVERRRYLLTENSWQRRCWQIRHVLHWLIEISRLIAQEHREQKCGENIGAFLSTTQKYNRQLG